MGIPIRTDCIHNAVCKFDDRHCPLECGYFKKENAASEPLLLADVLAEINAEHHFDNYHGNSINIIRLEKILSKYFSERIPSVR